MDRETLQSKIRAIPYWYHRIELPGGVVTPGWAPMLPERYSIPADLTGKRVLDIGAWDGYWTWEALKRGAAEVVAIDDFSDTIGGQCDRSGGWATFDLCREAMGFTVEGEAPSYWKADENAVFSGTDFSQCPSFRGWRNPAGQICRRLETSIYDLTESWAGRFDVVFLFGTIYHCKHPLLALERIAAVCGGALYIETAALDQYSPYHGGLGKGYAQNDVVMEFYPGTEYGKNPGNWWVPTLQCAGAMMAAVGFKDIEAWPLTDRPAQIAECRGFLSGTKDSVREPALHPADVDRQVVMTPGLKVGAVMSVPRLGFQDNMTCAFKALAPLGIPILPVQGAFWDHCIEQAILRTIDDGADVILVLDYDTVFDRADVETLLRLMAEHPEAAALVSLEMKRHDGSALLTVRGRSGQMREKIPLTEFETELTPIATGHFGLTVLRVKDLLEIPHPWFEGRTNADGLWGEGRIDADIWFWKQLEKTGKKIFSANRRAIGHMELMIAWPDESGQVIYQRVGDYHRDGKPAQCWK